MNQSKKSHLNLSISIAIFIPTLIIAIVSLLSFIFPALLVELVSSEENRISGFEIGQNGLEILIFNIVLIIFGFIIYKNKFPLQISEFLKKLFSYEPSQRITLLVMVFLVVFYSMYTINELSRDEFDDWGDYIVVHKALEIWPNLEADDVYIEEQLSRYVRMFLLDQSVEIFGNVKIIPFFASICVVITTYFLAKEISKRRLAGIVSTLVLLQSFTFREYDTIAVYENFWTLFYLLSIYTIYKSWSLSPISYILSIFSKAIVLSYIPMSLFFVINSDNSVRKKILLLISYVIVISVSLIILSLGDSVYSQVIRFDSNEFLLGFSAWTHQLRFDYVILSSMIPLIIGIFIKSKNGFKQLNSFQFFFLGILIGGPILSFLTDFYFIHPYRFVPFIAMFAVSVGLFLTNGYSKERDIVQ